MAKMNIALVNILILAIFWFCGCFESLAYGNAKSGYFLTYEERIGCQKAIERVYWQHRIWPKDNAGPKPPLEATMPEKLIKARVEDSLKKSNALAYYWNKQINGEQLQAEMNRIARQTKKPEILKEIWNALDNDPHLIAECLARPNLTNRLIRNWYSFDKRFHGELKNRAKAELRKLTGTDQMKFTSGKYKEFDLKKSNEKENTYKEIEALPVGRITELREDEDRYFIIMVLNKTIDEMKIATIIWEKRSFDYWWETIKSDFSKEINESSYYYKLPSIEGDPCVNDTWSLIGVDKRTKHTAIWTGAEMIIWGGSFGSNIYNTGQKYNPGTDTWTYISSMNAPSARENHKAVWTGTEMIIWGGVKYPDYLNTGGRYNPATDTWIPVAINRAPGERAGHVAVWTGDVMIIWGGYPNWTIGGRYNPAKDSWTYVTNCKAPQATMRSTAVWTGSEMIVWGGDDAGKAAYKYNPVSDSWLKSTTLNAPDPRASHTAIWTGSEMIIWGGRGNGEYYDTGGKYDPAYDSWIPTSLDNAPSERYDHSAIWNGSEMIIWGGKNQGDKFNTGGKYNPATDTWSNISTTNAPTARMSHTAVWTGTEMIVWGGVGIESNKGGRYDPSTDAWIPTSIMNSPSQRMFQSAVWTGTEMIVWGGLDGDFSYIYSNGARYNPITNDWMKTSDLNVPIGRYQHTSIWTGTEMIIWGGCIKVDYPFPCEEFTDTGGIYNPELDSWSPFPWQPTSTVNAPSPRMSHTAVWTGSEMIIWGGNAGSSFKDGKRYNRGSNSWTDISSLNAPHGSVAVWTGSEMIVWSGLDKEGGIYNPANDTWTPTAINNAPNANYLSAVWTGSEMIVWGGTGGPSQNSGGRYNPISDSWIATSTINQPERRVSHTAIWTGIEMIIWGGYYYDSSTYLYYYFDTGGKYNPKEDSWTQTATIHAPSSRTYHSATWADPEMIIWGGNDSSMLDTGGLYCPCVIIPPINLSAEVSGINQITLNWSSVPEAIAYNVYKKNYSCNESKEELIASNITSTTYIDNDVSGGITYYYSITAISQCESNKSDWVSVTATGGCLLMPCFAGANPIVNNKTNPCSLSIQWNAGISNCSSYPNITYAIYRNANPDFIPGPSNQIASCLTAESYIDSNVFSGITYYYIVRAEDSGTSGNGPCNNGNIDTNLIRRKKFPTGPPNILFYDDFENGMNNWQSGSSWNWNNSQSHSGIYSANSGDSSIYGCSHMIQKNFVSLAANTYPELHFWTVHQLANSYDAGIVQASSNDLNWTKLNLVPDYPGFTNVTLEICIGNNPQPAFAGDNMIWTEYIADISNYIPWGTFKTEFLNWADGYINDGGWWIDDVMIEANSSCQNSSPNCSYEPYFEGLQTAVSAHSSSCQINLFWNAALSSCSSGPNITYHIYKSTDPYFEPSSINRIASCVAGTSYVDNNVAYGINYYYIVRAEDTTSNGDGPCNNGNSDINLIRKKASPNGPFAPGTWLDNMEWGANGWSATGLWHQVDNIQICIQPGYHSPANSWYYGQDAYCDYENGSRNSGYLLSPIIEGVALNSKLDFWYFREIGESYPLIEDVTKVEVSGNNGPWTQVWQKTSWNHSENAWTFSNYIDLSAFAEQNIQLKFSFDTMDDLLNIFDGWAIDDVEITDAKTSTICTFGGGNPPGSVMNSLTISKSDINLILTWMPPANPCQTTAYSIYRGSLPWSGYDHVPLTCVVSNNSYVTLADADNYYYLVVAQNIGKEGSYGIDSSANQIPASSNPCLPQEIGNCDNMRK